MSTLAGKLTGFGYSHDGVDNTGSKRLTLEAADGFSPTIDAGDGDGTAVGIEASDVRVEGFTVQNFNENGITIFGSATGAEVVGNTVDTSSTDKGNGFAINTDDGGAANLLIKDNELGYGDEGSLQLNQNSGVDVTGNTISNAEGQADGTQVIGITIAGGGDITITENTISDADLGNENSRGILAGGDGNVIPGVTADTDNLDINSNSITDNDVGIALYTNSVSYSLSDNTIERNRVDTAAL